jgi:predicted transcriptional regulator
MAKIKIDSDIYSRAKKIAETAGYSSVQEFITHAIENALARHETETAKNDEKVAEQLRGLGYIE